MKFFQTFSIIKPHEKEKREKQSSDGVGVGQWGLREGDRIKIEASGQGGREGERRLIAP